MIHEVCSELIFTAINYAHKNMLLSTVAKSHQVSVPTSKVSKISTFCLLVGKFWFYSWVEQETKTCTVWFTSGSFQTLQRSYQWRQTDTGPVRLHQFLHYRNGTQLTTALAALTLYKIQRAVEGTRTESRGSSQPPGCPDHAGICQLRWRKRILLLC